MTPSAMLLDDAAAAAWHVERGRLFVFVADGVADELGPRALVAELPEGATLVTEGRDASAGILIGVPSTAAYVRPLDHDELLVRLADDDGVVGIGVTVAALWAGAEATRPPSAGVVPLEPGPVTVGAGAVAESADAVVWVGARSGAPQLPDGPLPADGMLVAPRVRISAIDTTELELEVRLLADAVAADLVPRALAQLLGRAVTRARARAAADEARVLEAERRRIEHDALAEQSGIARLAEVVVGPSSLPPASTGGDPFLACAAMVAAHGGFELRAESAALEGREGVEAVRVLARSSGVRWRRVRLDGAWWRNANDPLLGYRSDGTPLALLPVHDRCHCVESDGTAVEVTRDNADQVLDVAFVFSPALADEERRGRGLARFVFAGARSDAIVLALLGLLAGIVGLAIPLATGVVFDEIVPLGDTERLAWLVAVLVMAAVALAFLQNAQAARQIRLEARASRRLSEAVWDRVVSLPTSVASRFGIGDLAGRVLGLDGAREVLGQAGAAGVATTLASLLVIGVLFLYDPTLAVIAVAAGLLALVATLAMAVSVGRRAQRFQENTAVVNGFLLEVLRGLPKLRVAGGEARAFDAWASRYSSAMGIDVARAQARLQVALGLLTPLGTLLLFGSVSALGGAAAIGVGTFMAFQATYSQYLGSVSQIANTVGTAWQARPLVERGAALLEEEPETGHGLADPGVLSGAVELRDVVFRYADDAAPVLNGLDLRAGPGEFLALVGHSGCGKSTVVRLLLGFEAPEAGSVLYDERELGSLDVAGVRRQLGVVLQDSQLTPGSIMENISAGISLTEDEVWGYAELAALADDVHAMPMGLQTMVTPGAGAFSGGQRQRILLARALARRPSVLILDEATSALDNVTQGVVAHNVARLGITRIVVAHRLSTIASADRIVVLDEGRVAEQGTHETLMARGGVYAGLVTRQVV